MKFKFQRDAERGKRQREDKIVKAQTTTPITTTAHRLPGAIKPTTQRTRGRHLRSYEIDPCTCDPRDLAILADEALDELDTSDERAA